MPTTSPRLHTASSRIWLGMLVLYLVWGSTYLGISIAVASIPPFLMAAVRFLLAGTILLTWSVARDRRSFVVPTRRQVRDSAIVGALLLGGGMGFVAFAEQTVPSGIAALLIATMPIWVAVFGGIFLGERLPRLAILGIVVGFVGVAVLAAPSVVGGAGALEPISLLFCLLSPLAWASGSLFASHRAILPARPLVATGLQMLLGGAVLSAMAVATGEIAQFDLAAVTRESLVGLLYLTVVGSLLAFTVYGYMLRVAPLPLVTTYAYVNPIVAVILGAIVLGETIDGRTVVAGTIIVVAVALIVTARGRMAAPRASRPTTLAPLPASDEPASEPASGPAAAPTT
jgi:drug/metabolite transporter (DMT)-like permease